MEFENVEIGKEMPPLQAERVKVLGIEERPVVKDEKSIGTKLVLKVKHSIVPEMEIGKVKYEFNKKLKISGLWLRKDTDSKLPYNSAVAFLLRYCKAAKPSELIGKEIDTTLDENGFIVAKAY